uniref:Chloride channel CLIC-like protein 1 n=1 Tax=Acanthochromis polyacanthus TaxID=80966 RepID=A0A3Q1FBR0_9TELE
MFQNLSKMSENSSSVLRNKPLPCYLSWELIQSGVQCETWCFVFIQIDDQKKMIELMSQQPTCNQLFKRILNRLRKEIQRVGVPSDSTDVFYDAKIKLSRQTVTEIQTLLEGEDRWRTGALDDIISQIPVDLKPHDNEPWKWRFEDTFGVELNTVLMMGLGVLIIKVIICTELWWRIPWLKLSVRLLIACFLVSIVLNWLHLYKVKRSTLDLCFFVPLVE